MVALKYTGMRDWTVVWRGAGSGTKGTTIVRSDRIEGALAKFYDTFKTNPAVIITSISDGSPT